MKKQIIIAASIFLAITIIIVIYYFTSNQRNNTANQSSGQQTENNNRVLLQVNKLNCEDIKDAEAKETCQAGVKKILNSDNNSVCEDLTSEADKSTCHQAYIIKQAAQSGDLNKCQIAGSTVLVADCNAQVSFSLAIQKKDMKYCKNIINKTDKDDCLKILAGMGVK